MEAPGCFAFGVFLTRVAWSTTNLNIIYQSWCSGMNFSLHNSDSCKKCRWWNMAIRSILNGYLRSYLQQWLAAVVSAGGGPTKYWELLEWVNTDPRHKGTVTIRPRLFGRFGGGGSTSGRYLTSSDVIHINTNIKIVLKMRMYVRRFTIQLWNVGKISET